MTKTNASYPFITALTLVLFLAACNNSKRTPPTQDIAETLEQLDEKIKDNLRDLIEYAATNNGNIGDSVFLFSTKLAQDIYEKNKYSAMWSSREKWKFRANLLLNFITTAKLYGLFPDDYYFQQLDTFRTNFTKDSLEKSDRRDAAKWAKADLMLTDAFLKIVKDIKLGRLPNDSITLRKDSVLTDDFYLQQFETFIQSGSLTQVVHALEPKHKGYQLLKAGIPEFLEKANGRPFTQVPLPGKDIPAYKKALQARLQETGYLPQDTIPVDSLQLVEAIKKFQKKEGLTVDGKAGAGTLRMLNMSDEEKFVRIAITMDRYKMLPDTMPIRYVWVNLPGYYMKLIDADTVRMVSKIICGKPATRTPVLTSAIGEMITYPQWTIPTSIIIKEILPGVKKDTAYLAKKGYSLIDKEGNEVDPHTVVWSKYTKGLPYKVIQGSGDDNALGILKFNFNNKYAVYMHDTNQRYLFAQIVRSLSHGCVRVQEWEKLAYTILRYDNGTINDYVQKTSAKEDSLNAWLKRKEKHSLGIRNKLPVYIRYFTCEGSENGIVFYDDMYGEDKILRERYFAGK